MSLNILLLYITLSILMSYVSYTSYCTISLNLFSYLIVKCTWNDTVSFTVCFINKFIIIIIKLNNKNLNALSGHCNYQCTTHCSFCVTRRNLWLLYKEKISSDLKKI